MRRRKPQYRARRRRRGSHHCGTTLVETALVLPVFLAFVLGLMELSHAYLVTNVMRAACREAARMGSVSGTSSAQVKQKALYMMGSTCKASLVTVFVKDASAFDGNNSPATDGASLENLPAIQLTNAAPRQLFLVRAKVHYNDIAIVLGGMPARTHASQGEQRTLGGMLIAF